MALPGTPGQRISDLCNGNHITQKQLAKKIGVSASQLSRIVSGETKTVSSDILIGVAKEFKVSTDYILGLSTLSVRKSYDISELGLSEGAVRGLVTGTVDVQILNRLLEHRNFPKLMDLIRIYFQDTAAKGIMARNQLIELATASLSDLMKGHPEHRAEARQDLHLLNAQKMGEHEAEIEKIKKDTYCLFIAPTINPATLAHFYGLNHLSIALYGGKSKIIPLELDQFMRLIENSYNYKTQPVPNDIRRFLDYAIKLCEKATDENHWRCGIQACVDTWLAS